MAAAVLRKRIVVCCDGTWYASDAGETLPSNVGRMSRSIAKIGRSADGPIHQVAYYQSGVGTGAQGVLDKYTQAAFGIGLSLNVCKAYQFIATNYQPGDEIFLFGFSRGAFTARSVAGLICEVGLLEPTAMEFFDDMFDNFRTKGTRKLRDTKWALSPYSLDKSKTNWAEFTSHLQPDVSIKAIGVWDTVGSLGLPENFFTRFTGWNQSYKFHNTRLDQKIENAFHALALDERRGSFPPTLWYLEDDNTATNLRQCWFPGYHADIGGGTTSGYEDAHEIDEITFAWMCDQISPFLQLDSRAIDKTVLQRILTVDTVARYSLSKLKQGQSTSNSDIYAATWSKIYWGKGAMKDPFSLAYRLSGGQYVRKPGEGDVSSPTGAALPPDKFREEIHPSVQYRMRIQEDYKPRPLTAKKGWCFRDGSDSKGRRWVKSVNGKDEVTIMEYVIPQATTDDVNSGSLERKFAPQDLLIELDQASALCA